MLCSKDNLFVSSCPYFFNRSLSIPRSGLVARHESCRELLCPSHVPQPCWNAYKSQLLNSPKSKKHQWPLFKIVLKLLWKTWTERQPERIAQDHQDPSETGVTPGQLTQSNESLFSGAKSYFLCASLPQKIRNSTVYYSLFSVNTSHWLCLCFSTMSSRFS